MSGLAPAFLPSCGPVCVSKHAIIVSMCVCVCVCACTQNNLDFPVSFSPDGGLVSVHNTTEGQEVAPGATFTYTWIVPVQVCVRARMCASACLHICAHTHTHTHTHTMSKHRRGMKASVAIGKCPWLLSVPNCASHTVSCCPLLLRATLGCTAARFCRAALGLA